MKSIKNYGLLYFLLGASTLFAQRSFSPFSIKAHTPANHGEVNGVSKRALSDDRAKITVHQNWDQDSSNWRTYRDTTFNTYYTNGLIASQRTVFPSDWGSYENYKEYQYDGAGRIIQQTYFDIDPNTEKYDTSSISTYKYDGDILVLEGYYWRMAGNSTWEDWNETRYNYLLASGTDLVSMVEAERRSKDVSSWTKEQRTYFEYNANNQPKTLKLEIWDADNQRYVQMAEYDTISWRKWVKNEHNLESAEFNMVEGTVAFLGSGRMRLRRVFDAQNNNTAEYTYFINTTDSVLSESTKYQFTYDSEGRAISRFESSWSADSMKYVPYQINYYYDYYTPSALSTKDMGITVKSYPNPAENHLFFDFSGEAQARLEIRELHTGKLVIARSIQSNKGVDVSDLTTGLYTYSIQTSNSVHRGTWIKN